MDLNRLFQLSVCPLFFLIHLHPFLIVDLANILLCSFAFFFFAIPIQKQEQRKKDNDGLIEWVLLERLMQWQARSFTWFFLYFSKVWLEKKTGQYCYEIGCCIFVFCCAYAQVICIFYSNLISFYIIHISGLTRVFSTELFIWQKYISYKIVILYKSELTVLEGAQNIYLLATFLIVTSFSTWLESTLIWYKVSYLKLLVLQFFFFKKNRFN